MARLSKIEWLDLGLRTLAHDGARAIRIDNLCAIAGRTKGSFYHHFKDRDAFVTALLDHWEQGLTARVIDQANKQRQPHARIVSLNRLASNLDADLERALRRWAGSETLVADGVARVDRRRIDYLASLWHQAKDITTQQAIDLAVMNYTSLIGFQQLYVSVGNDRRARIDRLYAELSARYPDRNSVLDGG